MRQAELTPVFVDDMPERLEEGRLYVSERHSLAMHLCCCGCREEVVTDRRQLELPVNDN
jgi:putative component of toxin-antitoxin plasmid stabilization module